MTNNKIEEIINALFRPYTLADKFKVPIVIIKQVKKDNISNHMDLNPVERVNTS